MITIMRNVESCKIRIFTHTHRQAILYYNRMNKNNSNDRSLNDLQKESIRLAVSFPINN
jgi:hypothetical protein